MERFDTYFDEKYIMPKREIRWYYYEAGEAYGPFEDRPHNKKFVERVCINKEEVDNYRIEYSKRKHAAINKWKEDLRKEYSYLSDKIYDMVFSRAFDVAHSYGYDVIASEMEDLVYFIDNIIQQIKIEHTKK